MTVPTQSSQLVRYPDDQIDGVRSIFDSVSSQREEHCSLKSGEGDGTLGRESRRRSRSIEGTGESLSEGRIDSMEVLLKVFAVGRKQRSPDVDFGEVAFCDLFDGEVGERSGTRFGSREGPAR